MKIKLILSLVILFIFISNMIYADKIQESPFAINGMGYFHIKKNPDIWNIGEERAKRIEDLGASFDRSDFWWGYIEPKKSQFDWTFPDAVVADYKNRKFRIFPILNYFSAWSGDKAPDSDEERELFGRYVFMVISRYKKDIRYWEVWNEPNLSFFWGPLANPKDYAKLLQVTYKAAKAADPTCTIVAPALSGVDMNFLEEIYKYGAGGNYDVFSYHYYRTQPPEKNREIAKDIQKIDDFLKKHDDIKPIWITEFGVQSYEGAGGVTEEEQAKLLVRNYMELLATGKVDRIFWFCLQDWTDDPKSPPWDAHLGLTRKNLDPKPSYYAYKTMTEKLTGKKFVGEIKTQKDLYQYLFSDETSSVMVCWTTETGIKNITLYTGGKPVQLTRLDGTVDESTAKEETVKIPLGDSPVYLEDFNIMEIQKAHFQINPWLLEIPRGIPVSANLEIKNILNSTLRGTLKINSPSGWKIDPPYISYSLNSGESSTYPIKIQTGSRTDTGSYLITVRDTTDNQNLFNGSGKEVYVIEPLQVSYQIPAGIKNKKKSVIKINIENLVDQPVNGEINLNLSDSFEIKNKTRSFNLSSAGNTSIPFEITRFRFPSESFNGRFAVTFSATGEFGTSGNPGIIDYNEDFTFFPIHHLKKPVLIDGDLTDWAGLQPLMDESSQILVKLDPKGFGGKDDLSGRVYLAWDPDYLYIAADINDRKLVLPPDTIFWDYDSLQLAFDTKNNGIKSKGGFDQDDYEFELALYKDKPDLFAGIIPLNNKLDPSKLIRYTVVKKKEDKGLIYELAIPKIILPELKFEKGSLFGFCALANDNDGQGRKGWLESTPGIGFGKSPGEYIRVILVD